LKTVHFYKRGFFVSRGIVIALNFLNGKAKFPPDLVVVEVSGTLKSVRSKITTKFDEMRIIS
jgi:hypothetical protein